MKPLGSSTSTWAGSTWTERGKELAPLGEAYLPLRGEEGGGERGIQRTLSVEVISGHR